MKNTFIKERKEINGREAIIVSLTYDFSLEDTFSCGQCFRYEEIKNEDGYREYFTVVEDTIIFAGQKKPNELIFYGASDEDFENIIRPYFDLDTDYSEVKADILRNTDSDFLRLAAEKAGGIVILKQDPWEALFSFIVSQNNNIPRIRKIIRELSLAYGVNIALQNGAKKCPIDKNGAAPCKEKCASCGRCYSFPKAKDVLENPELMLPSKPGFRYKYLLDSADKVTRGIVNLDEIKKRGDYEYTVSELSKILGVGLKVASCTALFGFNNLEAFPIDVWMRRAIDLYFGGKLDHQALGKYAGVAQQYIFHYIRNL